MARKKKRNKAAATVEETLSRAERAWDRRIDCDGELDQSILEWGKEYFPDYFTSPENVVHTWLDDSALMPLRFSYKEREDDYKLCLIAPRGAAKSTVISFLLVLWSIVHETEGYILVCSNTIDQAQGFVESVKKELDENEELAEDYPWACGRGETWSKRQIVSKNGITVKAVGSAGAIRGTKKGAVRPSLVIMDDPEGDKHKWSEVERKKVKSWVKETIMPIGNPGTAFLVAGTTIHEDGLVNTLHEHGNGWVTKKFRAIKSWPTHMKLWETWERIYTDHSKPDRERQAQAFYEQHEKTMLKGFESYWPERFSPLRLMKIRVDQGYGSFNQEYQNEATSADAVFDPRYFGEWLFANQFPEEMIWKTMTCDPSLGETDDENDYSAIVKLGVCTQKLFWIEIDMKRRRVNELINDMIERYIEFRPELFGVEGNGFQKLLFPLLKRRLKELNFARRKERKPILDIPFVEITNSDSKKARIRSLEPKLSTRRIRIVQNPDSFLLTSQLKRFPKGHDDGPDAVEMAIRLAVLLSHGKVKRKKKRTRIA